MDRSIVQANEKRYKRILVTTCVCLGFALPWLIWSSFNATSNILNMPVEWISPDYPFRIEYDQFRKRFNQPEVVFVSWDGCDFRDQRLQRLADALTADRPVGFAEGRLADYFPTVYTGLNAFNDLSNPDLYLSKRAAMARLKGVLIGPAGTSCAIVMVSDRGMMDRKPLIALLEQTAVDATGIPREELHIYGTMLEGVTIDHETVLSSRLTVPSTIVSFVVAALCLRSILLALPVLAISVIGQAIVLGMIGFASIQMNAVLIVLSPLVFVLTVSAGVHLVNYFGEARGHASATESAHLMILRGWKPTTMAVATTAIGLGSLGLSSVTPVSQFGIFGCFGCIFSVGLLFMVLPGVMTFQRDHSARVSQPGTGRAWKFASRILYQGASRLSWIVVVVALVLMIG